MRITFLHAGSHRSITTKGDAAGVGTAIIRVAVSVVALFIKVLVVVWLREGSNGCSQDVDGVGTRHLAPESRDMDEKATAGRKGLARTGQMEPAVVALNTLPIVVFCKEIELLVEDPADGVCLTAGIDLYGRRVVVW